MLKKLSLYIDVIELGSFTKAGEKNFVTQTAVSQNIKQLEKYYQTTLINRSSQPVQPTETGKILYQDGQKIIRQCETLKEKIENFENEKIKLAYSGLTDLTILDTYLRDLNKAKLSIIKAPMKFLPQLLLNNEIDVAVSLSDIFSSYSHIETLKLAQGYYGLAVGSGHPLYEREKVEEQEIYDYPLIMLSENIIGSVFHEMKGKSLENRKEFNIERTVDDIETELFVINEGTLAGFLPDDLSMLPPFHDIRILPINSETHRYEIVLAFNSQVINSFRTNFIKHFKK